MPGLYNSNIYTPEQLARARAEFNAQLNQASANPNFNYQRLPADVIDNPVANTNGFNIFDTISQGRISNSFSNNTALNILDILKILAQNSPLQHTMTQQPEFNNIGVDPFSSQPSNAEMTPSSGGLAGGLTANNMLGMVTSNNPNAAPPPVASAEPPPPTTSATSPLTTTPTANTPTAGPAATRPVGNSRFSVPNPFYSSVTSPLLNQAGNQIGTTPLNNRQFARPEMANALLRYFADTYGLKNGNIVTEQYAGGLGPSENELGIRFGNSNVLNAGLEYDRLQNRNGYSQQYLDAQLKDNLAPGSSGWNNYVTTGSMPGAMNSADAERAFAGNPNTDPNMNMFGLQSKLNQVQYNPVGGVTPSGWEGPNRGNQTSPSTGFFGTSNTTTPFARRTPSYAPLPGGAYDPATQQEWNPSAPPSNYDFLHGSRNVASNNSNGVFGTATNNTPFRSLPGNTGLNSYASALNNRAPLYNGSYNTRGTTGTYGRGY